MTPEGWGRYEEWHRSRRERQGRQRAVLLGGMTLLFLVVPAVVVLLELLL